MVLTIISVVIMGAFLVSFVAFVVTEVRSLWADRLIFRRRRRT